MKLTNGKCNKFNGKEFLLSCDDGQEEHLEELALYLNENSLI